VTRVHFVYPHEEKISCPHAIGRKTAERLRARGYEVVQYEWNETRALEPGPDDVLLGYNPLFLEAWEDGGSLGDIVVPRADAKLALDTLLDLEEPLGRGVWVHDATNNNVVRRYEIPEVAPPGDEDRFDVRAFGPFLVIRSKAPERTAEAFLRDTVKVQLLGKELGISDADINYPTALVALNRLETRN